MRLALVFLAGFLCSAMVFLVAAQAPSELGRYQIAPGWDTSRGALFQLDTYTGRLYARDWYEGRVYDLGTLDKPLAFRSAPRR
jgi:hypothetical protein